MKATCNKRVEDQFSLETHCDRRLADFLGPFMVASCQHALPTLCRVACAFGNVTNGAKINMWNTGLTPLSSILLCVGDAQQGKIRLMACTSPVVDRTDEKVAELVDQFLNAVELPHGSEKHKLTIRSTGFMDITPTELFVPGTGDWNMIKEYSEMALLLQDLGPRPWMHLTGRIDEAYLFMHSTGWIQETKGGGQNHASPSQKALLGTAKLQRDTRTNGSFQSWCCKFTDHCSFIGSSEEILAATSAKARPRVRRWRRHQAPF